MALYEVSKSTDNMLKKPACIEDHHYTDLLNDSLDQEYLVEKARAPKQPSR